MRIISGTYKGRRLNPPSSLPVRPTTDYAREALFNILNGMIDYDGLSVLDLYAGTGAVSLEFCSRGAGEVTAVDIERTCVDFIARTAREFGITSLKTVRANALVAIRRAAGPFDVVFADPPYEMSGVERLPALVTGAGILAPEGLFILEHSGTHAFKNEPYFLETRKYGRVHFSFFRMGAEARGDQYSSS